jgi:hypothetical protein
MIAQGVMGGKSTTALASICSAIGSGHGERQSGGQEMLRVKADLTLGTNDVGSYLNCVAKLGLSRLGSLGLSLAVLWF